MAQVKQPWKYEKSLETAILLCYSCDVQRSAQALLHSCSGLFGRTMEDTEKIRTLAEPVIEECGVHLYDIEWVQNGKDRTLQISIIRDDGTMDLDTCAAVSERLSEVLDSANVIASAYTLEVCSPGAERKIRDLSELASLPYVYVRLKHPVSHLLEFTGQVESYQDGTVTLSYRDKAVKKHVSFADTEIDFIRYAVQF